MKYLNVKIPTELFGKESNRNIFKLLNDFICQFCSNNNHARTFHYFFENENYKNRLEIRIDSDYDKIQIKQWLRNFFGNIGIEEIIFEEFKPETDLNQYGDAWIVAEKFFEISSRTSIIIKNESPSNLFRETKFIHCFLNQLGYDSLGKASFHNWTSGQMLMKYLKNQKF